MHHVLLAWIIIARMVADESAAVDAMRSADKPSHAVLRDNADAADATRRPVYGGSILSCAGRGEECD